MEECEMVATEGKSGVLAVILSIFIPGVEHFYLGSIGKGFAFLIVQLVAAGLLTTVVGAIIAIPVLFVNPIWAAIDSYMAAK